MTFSRSLLIDVRISNVALPATHYAMLEQKLGNVSRRSRNVSHRSHTVLGAQMFEYLNKSIVG